MFRADEISYNFTPIDSQSIRWFVMLVNDYLAAR